MSVLTDKEIETGINKIVVTAKSPINDLSEAEWTYLLKFTSHFESPVNHMYSNLGLKDVVGPDVSIGVGISIPNKAYADVVFHQIPFFVKGTGFSEKVLTPELVREDYDTAAGISRAEHPGLDYYYARMKTEIRPEDVLGKLPAKVKELVPYRLKFPEFEDFGAWPAQARVALCSYCYGITPSWGKAGGWAQQFRKALGASDFDTAGRYSFVTGWSKLKILAHRKLFWNAARILEQAVAQNTATPPTVLPPVSFPNPPPLNLQPNLRNMPNFSNAKPIWPPQNPLFPVNLGLGTDFDRLPEKFNGEIAIEPLVYSNKTPPPISPNIDPP